MSARLGNAAALAAALGAAALVALSTSLLPVPLAWVVVAGSSMEPDLRSGEIAFVLRRDRYVPGDVVAYRVPDGEPGGGLVVIHRIVGGSAARGFVVRGDNEAGVDPWRPRREDILGSRVAGVPRLGHAVGFVRTPLGLALLAAIVAGALACAQPPPRRVPAGFTRALPRA